MIKNKHFPKTALFLAVAAGLTGCAKQEVDHSANLRAITEYVLADRANILNSNVNLETSASRMAQSRLDEKQARLGADSNGVGRDVRVNGKLIKIHSMPLKAEHKLVSELNVFDPGAEALWPGNLVQSAPLREGILDSVMAVRAPMTLSIDSKAVAESGKSLSKSFVIMERPSHSEFAEARVKLLADRFKGAGQFQCNTSRTNSVDEAAYNLNVDASWLTGSLRADLERREKEKKQSYIVSCTEDLFSIVADTPWSPSAVFHPDQSLDGLKASSDPQSNPIGYVSSVKYGRRLLFVFDSYEHENFNSLAINGDYHGGTYSVNANASAQLTSLSSKSNMKIFAMGLSPEARSQLAKNLGLGSEMVTDFTADANDSNSSSFAVPLSYTVKYLSNNQTMRVGLAGVFQDVVTESMRTVNSVHLCADGDGIERGTAFSFEIYMTKDVMIKRRFTDGLDEHSCRSFDIPETSVEELNGKTVGYYLIDKSGSTSRTGDDAQLGLGFHSPDGKLMYSTATREVKSGHSAQHDVIIIR